MDILATNGSLGVMMSGLDSFLYAWDKKDKSLLVKKNPKTKYPHSSVSIETGHGDFVEALDTAGNIVWQGGDADWCHVPIGDEWTRLRFRKLPKPKLPKTEFEKARQTVTRYLYSDSPYSLGLDDKLTAAIKILQKKLDEVPEKYRHTAEINFRSRISYGETYENVEITYKEPETDQELVRRLAIEAERSRVTLAKKKTQLAKLKAELTES